MGIMDLSTSRVASALGGLALLATTFMSSAAEAGGASQTATHGRVLLNACEQPQGGVHFNGSARKGNKTRTSSNCCEFNDWAKQRLNGTDKLLKRVPFKDTNGQQRYVDIRANSCVSHGGGNGNSDDNKSQNATSDDPAPGGSNGL